MCGPHRIRQRGLPPLVSRAFPSPQSQVAAEEGQAGRRQAADRAAAAAPTPSEASTLPLAARTRSVRVTAVQEDQAARPAAQQGLLTVTGTLAATQVPAVIQVLLWLAAGAEARLGAVTVSRVRSFPGAGFMAAAAEEGLVPRSAAVVPAAGVLPVAVSVLAEAPHPDHMAGLTVSAVTGAPIQVLITGRRGRQTVLAAVAVRRTAR